MWVQVYITGDKNKNHPTKGGITTTRLLICLKESCDYSHQTYRRDKYSFSESRERIFFRTTKITLNFWLIGVAGGSDPCTQTRTGAVATLPRCVATIVPFVTNGIWVVNVCRFTSAGKLFNNDRIPPVCVDRKRKLTHHVRVLIMGVVHAHARNGHFQTEI